MRGNTRARGWYGESVNSSNNNLSIMAADDTLIDSAYAARRLFITLILMTLGGSSMYVVSVVLPEVQKDFAVSRADASLPYTLMMLGFGAGGVGGVYQGVIGGLG